MERRTWLMVISFAANGILLWLLILVWASRGTDAFMEGRALIDRDVVLRAQGPLYFGQAAEGSELAEAMPNVIYVVESGLTLAEIEFADASLTPCTQITIYDRLGRPCVSLDLDDGSMIHQSYGDDSQTTPQIGVRDTDGDGIPDTMVNWELKKGFEVDQELTWRPLPPREPRP